ncbi:MAG TPA: hypothetical protein VLN45_07770 [Ignavibacteriaceae bacterium]|nr:hypothetical protein [Ignavibacteriaceae bacterium]
MFGFVNSRRETRGLGGEVFRAKQKKYKIFIGVLGFIGFAILNLILYMMTKVNF